jgi:hypothetical protein
LRMSASPHVRRIEIDPTHTMAEYFFYFLISQYF